MKIKLDNNLTCFSVSNASFLFFSIENANYITTTYCEFANPLSRFHIYFKETFSNLLLFDSHLGVIWKGSLAGSDLFYRPFYFTPPFSFLSSALTDPTGSNVSSVHSPCKWNLMQALTTIIMNS